MSDAIPACPNCQSDAVVKNGRTRHEKQNYKCRDCGRQFVEAPQWRIISEETLMHYRSAVVRETAALQALAAPYRFPNSGCNNMSIRNTSFLNGR
ncbi:MAG: hypothetical protein CLLPBCKN_008449 [Chroococcidiopsis cubana SAG 39.79]|nr:hypothetical protein [Chroococcidiopsis cubana SAG 39.79]MDZ4879011.1 hypothetical protein [Chroococcidiopsis cubana SAG 39.79]